MLPRRLALADVTARPAAGPISVKADVRIGIARDAAFAFYYPGDLEALRAAGAELIPFNALKDARLPDVDALFLGGGFPEVHMQALEANATLRRDIRTAIENGLPAYAECGGLMYLARSLAWRDRRTEMVGVIPGDVVMHDRPQGRGYVKLRETGKGLWSLGATAKSGRMSSTTQALKTFRRIPFMPTTYCAAPAPTVATTVSCTKTCSPVTCTCGISTTIIGRRVSWSSCAVIKPAVLPGGRQHDKTVLTENMHDHHH